MKRITLFSLLAIGAVGFSFNSIVKTVKTENTTAACKYGQCKATAKSTGNRCKLCVSHPGDSYCSKH